MQSDELWESLGTQEQHILKKVHAEKIITSEDERLGAYLWNTGMIKNVGKEADEKGGGTTVPSRGRGNFQQKITCDRRPKVPH
jgi:hypothetical protein